MAFPKAKILRFNEEMTCAPPPGTYDPKYDDKVKGAVIEKSRRFSETKIAPATSLESIETVSTSSRLTGSFRTPQLPLGSIGRKLSFQTPRSERDVKKKPYSCKKALVESFKNTKEHELLLQIEELTRAHTSQLLEKDQEISNLQNEVAALTNQIERLDQNEARLNGIVNSNVESLCEALDTVDISSNVENHEPAGYDKLDEQLDEVNDLKNIKVSLEIKLEQVTQEYNQLIEKGFEKEKQIEELAAELDQCLTSKMVAINSLNEHIAKKEFEIKVMKNEIKEKSDAVIRLKSEKSDQIDEINRLKDQLEVSSTNAIQISDEYDQMKTMCNEKINECSELVDKINEKEECLNETKSQLTSEKENSIYLTRLLDEALLKEQKLENNIKTYAAQEIATNNQITTLKFNLNVANESIYQLQQTNGDLSRKLSTYADIVQNVEKLKTYLEGELNKVNVRCGNLESKLSNLETELSQLKITKELCQQNEEKLKAELNEVIASKLIVENELHDVYIENKVTKEKICEFTYELEQLNAEKCVLIEKTDKQAKKVGELLDTINDLQLQNNENDLKLENLHQQNLALIQENNNLSTNSPIVGDHQRQIEELQKRNNELESIIGPFKDQLIQFENERLSLLSKSENTEKELKAVVMEQAKVLGHQNHKQKIKHVVYLTETIYNLKKEMEKVRCENNKLRARILENTMSSTLKKTSMQQKNGNKENNSIDYGARRFSLPPRKENEVPKSSQNQ